MMNNIRVAMRHVVMLFLFFLPADRRKAVERWLRGREEFMRLQHADWVLMSWGKSGRTWLRVMLSRFYQVSRGLDERELLDFDNLRKRDGSLPAVFFTHNNYLPDYTGNRDTMETFQGKKIVLLVRDPRDVAVSQYFQWLYRMRPHKKFINGYPAHGAQVSAWEFVRDGKVGVSSIIDYFNGWARAMPDLGDVLVVRYEDMRADPLTTLQRILEFTGTPGTAEQVQGAVDFAAFENMKKMERSKFFKSSGARVKPGDKDNPQSFKVRKAKVGGYRDHFSDDQCAELDQAVALLDPMFGYGEQP
jgi:hypothetical protein